MTKLATSGKSLLLLTSIALNIGLLIFVSWLFVNAKKTYTDYRYFRALESGTSQSTNLAATESDDKTKIVLFGDSRIFLWDPLPALDDTLIINAGISGETTTEMQRRFDHDVLRHKPDIVIIQAGVNDLTAAVTKGIEDPQALIDRMHTNAQYFIETLKANDIEVIQTSIFPHSKYSLQKKLFWNKTLATQIKQSNDILKQITTDAGAQWLDYSPIFYSKKGSVNEDLYYDTLHITRQAYEQLNTVTSKLVSAL